MTLRRIGTFDRINKINRIHQATAPVPVPLLYSVNPVSRQRCPAPRWFPGPCASVRAWAGSRHRRGRRLTVATSRPGRWRNLNTAVRTSTSSCATLWPCNSRLQSGRSVAGFLPPARGGRGAGARLFWRRRCFGGFPSNQPTRALADLNTAVRTSTSSWATLWPCNSRLQSGRSVAGFLPPARGGRGAGARLFLAAAMFWRVSWMTGSAYYSVSCRYCA